MLNRFTRILLYFNVMYEEDCYGNESFLYLFYKGEKVCLLTFVFHLMLSASKRVRYFRLSLITGLNTLETGMDPISVGCNSGSSTPT